MYDIILKIRDENKTGKATFSKEIITLNETNPSETFSVKLENGWQIDDFMYIGGTYTITDNGNNTFTAQIIETKPPKEINTWFVNFNIVES